MSMLETHDIRALNLALTAPEIDAYAAAILQAVKDAGRRATEGDTPADPETARRLLAKRLREICRALDGGTE